MSRSKRTARARLVSLGITPRALLTATDAAAYLNVAPATFRNRVRRGLLPACPLRVIATGESGGSRPGLPMHRDQ